jgi:putative transposase
LQIPDDLWAECEPLLPPQKALGTPGRPIVPFRKVLDGILYVPRTGIQWKAVPARFGSGSTCHRRFQEWVVGGTWARLWADQLARHDGEQGIGWDWQSADGATVPSPLGGHATGPDPTNRGKLGTKRHIPSDRRGAPLGAVVSAANRNDMKLAEATLDSIVVSRPTCTAEEPQHLCRDKGFDYPETRQAAEARGYIVHTPVRGIDAPAPPPQQRFPARRWVLERTNSWHNRFRKLRIRYEKKPAKYLGLIQFACFPIVYRPRLVSG